MEEEGCREEYKKGLWTAEEDKMLMEYVKYYGKGQWNSISKRTGLKRCGKSCRLRWMNYLSPSVKKGRFTEDEEDLIVRLHRLLGNRWSLIAGRVPGRTDSQVKNYWNTHLSKKLGIFNKNKQRQTRTTVVSSTSVHCNGKKTTNIGMNPESSSLSVETNRKKKITGTATMHFNPHTAENVSGKDGADICENDGMRRKVDSDEVAADDEKTMEKEMQQPISGMVIVGSSEDSMMSSTVASFWVSEFDKEMSSSGEGNFGSFMELIYGGHLFGFG